MKQIRQRLTYANVMSSIAVFLVLGGATAFAATKIGSKEIKANAILTGKIKKEAVTTGKIKKNAVDGSRVKDGSLSGSDINLGSLGTVPSASSANFANVSNTTNQISGFTYKGKNGDSEVLVLNDFNGLSLYASCTSGNDNGLTTKASSSNPGGGQISWSSTWQGSGAGSGTANNAYSQMNPGSRLELTSPGGTTKTTNGSVGIGFSIGQIVYSQPDTGKRVTVNWTYNSNIAGNACYWVGNVVASG